MYILSDEIKKNVHKFTDTAVQFHWWQVLFQLKSSLTFHLCRTCRFGSKVEDDKSNADSSHSHEEGNDQECFKGAHFSEATRTCFFLHQVTRSEDAPRCGTISSLYRQHQQGVPSKGLWTFNPELFFVYSEASPTWGGKEVIIQVIIQQKLPAECLSQGLLIMKMMPWKDYGYNTKCFSKFRAFESSPEPGTMRRKEEILFV